MGRFFIVTMVVAALLACPLSGQSGCAHGLDQCAAPHGHDEDSPPAPHPHDNDRHEDDAGCSCVCHGALARSDAPDLVPMGWCEPLTGVAATLSTIDVSMVAHHRWRLLSPDSESESGRALRVRIASYLL